MTVIIESNYKNLWMLFDFFNYQQYVSIQKIGPKTDYIVFMQNLIFKFLHSTHLTPSLNLCLRVTEVIILSSKLAQ